MVQLHGKSAGMVSPRGKALDPAHSDSQRLSLALFPALGTSQAADGSGRSVNVTSCLLLNFHSFLHLGLPKSPTIHDRCSSLVGYLFRGSPEQRSNETRRPNQDENLILVARPKKNYFLYPSFRQKISMVPTKKYSAVLRAAMVSSRFLGYKIINEMERTRKFQARNLFEHFTAHNMYQCVKFTLICGDDLKQLVPFPQGKIVIHAFCRAKHESDV